MTGVISQIESWAATELKYWEQAALEKISNGTELSEEDFEELLRLFMEDAGVVSPATSRARLSFPDNLAYEAGLATCRLKRIFNLKDVNALPEKQEICFGPHLTLIYGDNGAGKTGYVRPLASAGFARGDRQVLPNATRTDRKRVPQADIEISYGDTKRVVTWTNGQRCPELDRFYVFDGTSLDAHLTHSNPLSFSPSGLSLLTRLAEVTDEVRDRVRQRITEWDGPNDFQRLFVGESEASKHAANMNAQTDLSIIEKLATLSDKEKKRVSDLEREIAGLKLLDISKQVTKRSQEMSDLGNLVQSITKAQIALGEAAQLEIQGLMDNVHSRRDEVERSGIKQFTSEAFTRIGSTQWLNFLSAAKTLADAEGKRGTAYPVSGDRCILCWQHLSAEALSLIQRFWEFLKSDAQARLESAEQACKAKILELERVPLSYFAADSNVRRLIENDLQIIIPAIEAQIGACTARRQEMVQSLRSYQHVAPPPLINLDLTDLQNLLELRRSEIVGLRGSNVGQRLTDTNDALRNLTHRQVLQDKLPELRTYLKQKKWAARASNYLGTTRIITTKYNELFKELVTERFTSLFEETLKRFKSDMRVTIETRGLKGETVRQIVLSRKAFSGDYSVDEVLSDGEKRAVAIADFLTEVTLDQNSNGVILDDPITSLDEKWKNTLAQCLVEQAKGRQVIIFTHDLSFLYHAKAHSEELSVDVVTHWVKDEDGQPGFVYLNNSPVCEKDYKSARIANELHSKAKSMAPAEQQAVLQQGFGALRTSYEALIIFGLFKGVVGRFEERISFDRLRDVRIDQVLVEKIIKRMAVLSRYIDAHLHSDKFATGKPSPEILREEIDAFEAIRKAV